MLMMWLVVILQNEESWTLKPKAPMVRVSPARSLELEARQGELIHDLVMGAIQAAFSKEQGTEEQIRGAVNNGWLEGDHGDVSDSRHQKEIYEKNRERVLNKHSPELLTVYSTTQAHSISPEPDPTKTYTIQASNGTCAGGKVLDWQQLGCMQFRSGEGGVWDDIKSGSWKLSARIGPDLPPDFWHMNACERANWQIENNKQVISYRLLLPSETYPQLMVLRPPSFFDYFENHHDSCAPCYEEAPYYCEPCPREDPYSECSNPIGLAFYQYLPMAMRHSPSEYYVWELDYHIGNVADFKANWPKEVIDNGRGGHLEVPLLVPGEDKIKFEGKLQDLVEVDVVCGDRYGRP